jgi:hypothetical protein
MINLEKKVRNETEKDSENRNHFQALSEPTEVRMIPENGFNY